MFLLENVGGCLRVTGGHDSGDEYKACRGLPEMLETFESLTVDLTSVLQKNQNKQTLFSALIYTFVMRDSELKDAVPVSAVPSRIDVRAAAPDWQCVRLL